MLQMITDNHHLTSATQLQLFLGDKKKDARMKMCPSAGWRDGSDAMVSRHAAVGRAGAPCALGGPRETDLQATTTLL